MSETTYSVQLAKTSRAKCKSCKEPIQKGEIKLFVEAPLREGASFGMSSSHHVSCFKIPRKLASSGVGVEEFLLEYLVDDPELLEVRKDEILGMLRAAATKTKSKAKSAKSQDDEGPANIMDRLKEAAKLDDDDEPAKKKAKTKKPTKEEEDFKAMLSLYRKYDKGLTVSELKDILRWNKQIIGGTKAFVLFKVIDGELHGRLSMCPLCQGDLKYLEGDYDKIHCSGRFDEDIGRRIPCSYSTPRLANPESVRAHPFYTEEPSEEEKDALEKIKEEVREGGGAGVTKTADNPIAQELLKAAKSLDGKLDFSSNAGRKQAVGEFVALVEGKVDLPQNRNPKMEIGKLIMANYDGKSAEEIMQVIFDKYGFANVKEEKAAAKEAAAEAACANPKNAGLILALGECAKYYFAESNTNAALSYKKATTTLTQLEEEVTEDNAMSFSKGKSKLVGIGKATAQKMQEFCRTGTFAKLEEKRAAHA